ncbi:mediator-associated protein 2 [Pyrus ussuriensis x Pyrus communis]|uniref:Mediator-associated protein 2 n=1 Tax=Pyrus ussuriensis x Pyrus communis TaxID=2448454 RepID=A0A5N5HBN9_9ROSA|nr:mediator-associated protein 2 [Pyrus ussuriensis x Pyrus communis]
MIQSSPRRNSLSLIHSLSLTRCLAAARRLTLTPRRLLLAAYPELKPITSAA